MKKILNRVWNAAKLNKEKSLGVLRHVLTFVGGFLVVKGYLEESVVEESIGVVLTIVGIFLSLDEKTPD